MPHAQHNLTVQTSGVGAYEITRDVASIVQRAKLGIGLAHIFCQHTSCSLVIQENADPDVQRDLRAFLERLVPNGDRLFIHTAEGPDDMPAHVKAALTQTTLTIPITNGHLALGTWQGIFLLEHRLAPHTRQLIVHLCSD
jgi:secondary thiamine-phosphate synthase enzyme